MEDKYWRLIIVIIILLAGLIIFLSYINTIEKYSKIGYDKGYEVGYNNKICQVCEVCPICEDCRLRIDYCFVKCTFKTYGNPIIVESCVWDCLNSDYPNPDEICKDRIHIMCVGHWEIINNKCYWNCDQAEFVKEE